MPRCRSSKPSSRASDSATRANEERSSTNWSCSRSPARRRNGRRSREVQRRLAVEPRHREAGRDSPGAGGEPARAGRRGIREPPPQLEARLARARARAEQARVDLDRSVVRAPFSGRIAEVMVSPGDRVRPGDRLLESLRRRHARNPRPDPHPKSGHGPRQPRSRPRAPRLGSRRRPADRRTPRTADESRRPRDRWHRCPVSGDFGGRRAGPRPERGAFAATAGAGGFGRVALRGALRPRPDLSPRERSHARRTGQRLGETQAGDGKRRVIVRSRELVPGARVIVTQLPNASDGLRVRVASTDRKRRTPPGRPAGARLSARPGSALHRRVNDPPASITSSRAVSPCPPEPRARRSARRS